MFDFQILPEVKIPIPAPRTSLLNRTPSHSKSEERSGSGSSSSSCSLLNDSINVTVTESPDRQRSIISISSNDFAVTTADLLEAAAAEMSVDVSTEPSSEDLADKAEDLEDDVFQPQIESPSAMPVLDVAETDSENGGEAPKEETVEMVKRVERELSPKPVIVSDFNAGTVKVNDTTVIIRKKTAQPKKDEEPELMKVFARRSLKLKETDSSADEGSGHKSRDSDKENEDANTITPLDEQSQPSRKKKNEAPDAVIAAVPPKPTAFGRFQRSVSHDTEKSVLANSQPNHVNDKRQRCKSAHDVDKRESDENKVATVVPSMPVLVSCDEKPVTPFKRIQQRREEWEKRAQQAMKVHGTK